VEDRGGCFIKSPRFHCELQFIEPFWRNAKKYMRNNCNYKLSALRAIIPSALRITTIKTLRRYHTRFLRFMDAYKKGLSTHLAHYVTKKYRSHRRLNDVQIDIGLEQQGMLERQRNRIDRLRLSTFCF
jgi:hypothetical protein